MLSHPDPTFWPFSPSVSRYHPTYPDLEPPDDDHNDNNDRHARHQRLPASPQQHVRDQ